MTIIGLYLWHTVKLIEQLYSYSASIETYLGNTKAECFLMGGEYCEIGRGQEMVKIKK